ncbi:MAG: helix-turn-helix transcriptional regulator [Verrucomicrobia bacterium]|nr:helix-turn-helix transcriptional regulator [Verrucomicrobiota bacterium]MDA1088525.1 helix-turn-helix transcriptional regulator [Verrucomicrobiota bacterium]
MSLKLSVSEQLLRRRSELGLSLSEVARRAGTSAATLSRYEHGWTRFETYTLRKLALALECELRIELAPRAPRKPAVRTKREACERLKRLFWDHPLSESDLDAHRVWAVERVLEYGALDDVHALYDILGHEAFLTAVASADRVSPRTRNFWCRILEMEGIACTKKYSRNTAWIS